MIKAATGICTEVKILRITESLGGSGESQEAGSPTSVTVALTFLSFGLANS